MVGGPTLPPHIWPPLKAAEFDVFFAVPQAGRDQRRARAARASASVSGAADGDVDVLSDGDGDEGSGDEFLDESADLFLDILTKVGLSAKRKLAKAQ